jgi:hypothetical protein
VIGEGGHVGWLRGLGITAVVTAVAGAGQATAYAAIDANDTITGVETAATSTEGTFVGTASGQLPGAWRAVVDHAVLPRNVGASTAITGGTFALFTVIHADAVTIHGAFARRSAGITMLSAGAGCKDQRFRIKDRLTRVGIRGHRDGAGTVSAVLTHYRTRILGHCVTYSASVAGTITLTFG